MDVRYYPRCTSAVVLIGLSACPKEEFFTQEYGLYVGGDQDAFFNKYPAPVTPIVSPGFVSRDVFSNPFHRNSSSILTELLRPAFGQWTLMDWHWTLFRMTCSTTSCPF